jgi:hypothetical protein
MPAGSITVTTGAAVVPALRRGYPAPTMTLLKRLASPAGFALAMLLFLFPFAAISCEAPGLGSVEVTYTGVDYATGGDPDVETIGDFGREAGDPVQDSENPPKPEVQPLALITLVLLLCGLAATFLPTPRLRLSVAAGASLLAAAMLVVTQTVATGNLESSLIDTRAGFWLALLCVVAVFSFHIVTAVRARSQR